MNAVMSPAETPVMTIAEIETAIRNLPSRDVCELAAWLDEYRNELWDRQIEDDLANGRLDGVLSEVRREIAEGKFQPL